MTTALLLTGALLIMGCTKDNIIAENAVQPTDSQKIHVTVGAELGDCNGTTRAAVDDTRTDANGNIERTLTFTAGDRLYVKELLKNDGTRKYLAGYLDIVGSPAAGATIASFSGDLSVYLADGTPSTYDFGDADPLTADVAEAWFVPADAPAGFIVENINALPTNDAKMIAADVNTLMVSAMHVRGSYNGSTKSFSLSGQKPILNCTIGSLSNNTEYTVKLRYADNQSYYVSNYGVRETTYDAMTVTSDGEGIARFAISGLTNSACFSYNFYYALQFVPVGGGETMEYVLGQKDFGVKVYNVTKGFYDSTCRLTVSVQDDNDGVVVPGRCDVITIKCDDDVLYQTPPGATMMFINGQETIIFPMDPVTDATLTIIGTKNTTDGTVTYVGTATGVTILRNQTTNVGLVTLGKGM